MPADEPLRTICAQTKGGHHALVTALLAKHYGGHETPGWPLDKPISTLTTQDHHHLVTAQLVGCGGRAGQSRPRDASEPMATLTAKADTCLVMAHMLTNTSGHPGAPADEPMRTIATGGHQAVVTSNLAKLRGTSSSAPTDAPLHTVSAQGWHHAEVRALLIKYYGNERDGCELSEPMHTVTSRDRFGLVTVDGDEYAIADIGMRMLAPRELYRAQGFPEAYIIGDDPRQGLALTKTAQVRMVGNSVCPPLAAALVRANVSELAVRRVA